jgi:hypothetical protein
VARAAGSDPHRMTTRPINPPIAALAPIILLALALACLAIS